MAVRGQATTEAALGILVISTVIVFGIHFSEVSMLSLKVQEAATAAIWDVTGQKMHTLTSDTPNFAPRLAAIRRAGPDASSKYRDFDGRASKDGNAPTLVFTQASAITVTCTADNSLPPMALSSGPISAMFGAGQGGMSCFAQSTFGLVPRFSRNFLENQPFREQHVQRDTYPICSMGRASGNNCPARAVVVLGDWGLAENQEANECALSAPGAGCLNPGYYEMTQRAFRAYTSTPTPPGNALSTYLFGSPKGGPQVDVDENAFFMAAVGEDWNQPSAYRTGIAEHWPNGPYTVTPGGHYDTVPAYEDAAGRREACAFGLPCNPANWHTYQ